jgi:large subunit ribosomal protein L28
MPKICPITYKYSQVAGGYSNRTRATQFNPTGKRRQKANLQKKKIFVPEIGRSITLELSTQAIKSINKNGAFKVLKQAGLV